MDFRRPMSVVAPTLDGDVLGVLAGAEEEFTGRQIHRVLGRGSEQGVRKAADRLVGQGIVMRRQAGRAKLYSLNRNHLAAPYVEGLTTLRAELIKRLRRTIDEWEVAPSIMFLFGSVARGEASAKSDLDIFVIRPPLGEEEDRKWHSQIARLENRVTLWTGNETRVIEYRVQDLSDPAVRGVADQAFRDGLPIAGTREQLRTMLREESP